jgi:hypothetical protein
MTTLKRTTLLALVAASLLGAGCGSDDEGEPIPQDSSAVLQDQLDNVQARIDNGSVGACEDILSGPRGPNVDAVNQAIADLPDDVSEDVRAGLQDGFDHLFQLVDERCTELRDEADSRQQTETETEPEPEPEPEPAPPETDTETQTETVPPETDTETQTETTPPTDTGEQPTPTEEQPPTEEPQGTQGNGGVLAPEGEQG